jgi:predicted nucleic acid-binding protein
MIVADTNMLVAIWVQGDFSKTSLSILNREREWIAPILWRSEFRSALRKYLKANIIDSNNANRMMSEALNLMQSREFTVDSYSVIELIATTTVSAYDAEYIALAQETESRLVTFDRKLINLFPDVAIHPEDFLNETSS